MIGGARGVGVAGVGWAYVCSVVSPKLPSRGLEAAGVQVTLWPLATCFSPLCGVRVPTLHVAVCPGHQCVVLVQGQEAGGCCMAWVSSPRYSSFRAIVCVGAVCCSML